MIQRYFWKYSQGNIMDGNIKDNFCNMDDHQQTYRAQRYRTDNIILFDATLRTDCSNPKFSTWPVFQETSWSSNLGKFRRAHQQVAWQTGKPVILGPISIL